MGRKKTKEEYEAEWMGKVFGYTEVGEYSHTDKHSNAYFWCTCLRCGEKFGPVRLSSLKSGNTTSCGHCLERTEIGNRYGHYVVKEYHHRDKHGRLYFLCDCDCGNDGIVMLNNLKTGNTISCGHCLERTEIGKRYGHYVIREYHHRDENGNAYFLCECDCGEERVVMLGHLKSGASTSCGHCLERTEIGNRYGYYVVKEYHHRGKRGQAYFLCDCDCGNDGIVMLNSLKTGLSTSCGCRTESKGEEKIRLMLEEMEVKFEQEYTGFTDMKDERVLRCDFWLPRFNRVIEFDGELHYQISEYHGGKEKLEDTQRRDQIKNQYCWDHGIDIVRIPYWEIDNFTMEDLVSSRSRFLIRKEG